MRLRLVAASLIAALSFQCGTDTQPREPSSGEPSEPEAGGPGGESATPSDAGAPSVGGADGVSDGGASNGGASDGGASDGGGGGPTSFIDGDLEGPLPKRLSELGLYPEPQTRSTFHARAVYYEPRYPLWSNGSEKQRFVVLPRETSVDTASASWEFPVGTTFFKTF